VALSENDDLEHRGRAIFDRLRQDQDGTDVHIEDNPESDEQVSDGVPPQTDAADGQGSASSQGPESGESGVVPSASPVRDEVADDERQFETATAEPPPRPDRELASEPQAAHAAEADAADSPPEAVIAVVADAATVLEDSTALAAASPVVEAEIGTEVEVDGGGDAVEAAPAHPAPAGPPPVAPIVRPLPRVLAIANQKGGVGKTTTAVNLGAALAELGYRVLVVDLDPQGNATTGLGINPRALETSVYDVIMHDTPLEDCIEPTSLRNLFVVPATIDLAGAEIELVPAFSRELKLRRALDNVADDFDYTLIDCPPSLGLITVNGLAAATEVIVPIQCEYYALEGLGQLLRNVSLVQQNLNPKLEVSAIILTMFDARTKLAEQVAGEVRAHFGDKVCRNIVPRTVRLSEAPSFGQPIIVFDPSSRGAIAYRELAKEVSGGAPQRTG
jgi:chromosome partitioning protein